jgi:ribosomal protein S18 acetylase RimI-like enzyme
VPNVVVRPYVDADRRRVREICFLTGYLGDPVGWLWRDAESFADVFTRYYTDCEPGSAQVAELDGEVVGYLLGCLDSKHGWNPTSAIGRQVVSRGIAFRRGTAGFLWRSVGDVITGLPRGRLPPPRVTDPRWPAHLHVDLLPVARGQGVGAALMRHWLDRLRAEGVPGCHLETVHENTGAVAFFEAMGFHRQGPPLLAPGLRTPTGARHHVQLMVQPLGPSPV